MPGDLRRKNDKVMESVQADIKEIKGTLSTVVDSQQKMERGLFGSEEFKEEGVIGKVERHEVAYERQKDFPYREVKEAVINFKFMKGAITFIGIGNVALILWLIFGGLVERVIASR